jgi:hypothetical protein
MRKLADSRIHISLTFYSFQSETPLHIAHSLSTDVPFAAMTPYMEQGVLYFSKPTFQPSL